MNGAQTIAAGFEYATGTRRVPGGTGRWRVVAVNDIVDAA
jgi:hypothetical protein